MLRYYVYSEAPDGTRYKFSTLDYGEWNRKINQDKEAGYAVMWEAKTVPNRKRK